MLKIDVEGAEGDILDGASDAVLENVQTACIEWHENIVPGVYDRCVRRLRDANFLLHQHFHPWNEGIFYAAKPDVYRGPVAQSRSRLLSSLSQLGKDSRPGVSQSSTVRDLSARLCRWTFCAGPARRLN